MDNYSLVGDDLMGSEEDSVLRLWESPNRDYHDLLSLPLLPIGEANQAPPVPNDPMLGPLETVQATDARGVSSDNLAGRGNVVAPSESVAAAGGGGASPPVAKALDENRSAPFPPVWSLFTGSNNHSTCWVLREMVHADDHRKIKLSLHGEMGVIYHAILEIDLKDNGPSKKYIANLQQFDAASIKKFLLEYSSCRMNDGQRLIEDTNRKFYDALSIEMELSETGESSSGHPVAPN